MITFPLWFHYWKIEFRNKFMKLVNDFVATIPKMKRRILEWRSLGCIDRNQTQIVEAKLESLFVLSQKVSGGEHTLSKYENELLALDFIKWEDVFARTNLPFLQRLKQQIINK